MYSLLLSIHVNIRNHASSTGVTLGVFTLGERRRLGMSESSDLREIFPRKN
jgi:hypothetical protein